MNRIIVGNTTATPTPHTDWNQTDENKAGFLKNKPPVAIGDGVGTIIEGNIVGDSTYPTNVAKHKYTHAEGAGTVAGMASSGMGSHAEGIRTQAIGSSCHSEGRDTIAYGAYSHAQGDGTCAYGSYTHSAGLNTIAYGYGSKTDGVHTVAVGRVQSVSGAYNALDNVAKNYIEYVHSANRIYYVGDVVLYKNQLYKCILSYATVHDYEYEYSKGDLIYVTRDDKDKHIVDLYVAQKDLSPEEYYEFSDTQCIRPATIDDIPLPTNKKYFQSLHNVQTTYLNIIGNGTEDSNRSNAYTLDWVGNGKYAGSVSSTGADYAEYFEWTDGNVDNEDRAGYFVALDGNKIVKATSNSDVIGVVSTCSAMIGDVYEWEWHSKYLRDAFGRIIYEDVEVEYKNIDFDENGEETEVTTVSIERHPKLNPEYRPNELYIPRSERPEWDTVGFLGKLIVIDDGTCVVGGKCSCNNDGTATAGNDYRVLKRIDDSHIQILASFL